MGVDSAVRSTTGGRRRLSDHELGGHDQKRGLLRALDAREQQLQTTLAELGEVLAYGGEGRRKVGSFGDIVEAYQAHVTRHLASGFAESTQYP